MEMKESEAFVQIRRHSRVRVTDKSRMFISRIFLAAASAEPEKHQTSQRQLVLICKTKLVSFLHNPNWDSDFEILLKLSFVAQRQEQIRARQP